MRTPPEPGFVCLTTPYRPHERKILAAAVDELKRAGVSYRLVQKKSGIEIWRSGNGFKRFSNKKSKQVLSERV